VNKKEALEHLGKMSRQLKGFRELLSQLMSSPFAADIRALCPGSPQCQPTATGEIIKSGEWGRVRYGVAEHSCQALDDLLAYCGSAKAMFARLEGKAATATPAPWEVSTPDEDAYDLGQELGGDQRIPL
jgi:hypothetical protein